MAIGPDNQVTTTGILNKPSVNVKAPDMTGLDQDQPQGSVRTTVAPDKTAQTAESPDQNIDKKLAGLTEEEKFKLDTILSPSNAAILKKIAPEASSVIDQFTSKEEVLSLPVSTIVSYAMKIYGGDEKLAVQNFITDLSGGQPDNTNVPPDTATEPQGMMTQQSDDIPSDIQAIDEGEQLA